MENLRRLEEEFKLMVINLAVDMETMTKDQRRVTREMLAHTKNTSVRNSVKAVKDNEEFRKITQISCLDMKAVGTAGLVMGAVSKTAVRDFSEDVLNMSAKTFGKAAGGLMVGVGALFLISDGVTITKTAMRLWKDEPNKAAEMLRDLARKIEQQEEGQDSSHSTSELSCPICWDCLTSLEEGRTVLSTPCGHLFCSPCLLASLEASSACPTCRGRVTSNTCNRIYLN